jgi:hypothetical protein
MGKLLKTIDINVVLRSHAKASSTPAVGKENSLAVAAQRLYLFA